MKILTQRIWKPKDGVAWEEKGALTRAMATDSARDVKVTLAYSAGIGFCALTVGFAISSRPGTACAAFSDTTARLSKVACRSMTDGRPQNLEPRSNQRLRAFLSGATGFERSANGGTPLRIRVAPNSQAHAVVSDCAASTDTCSCLLLVHGRREGRRRSKYGGRTEIGGGRTGVGERIVCVGVGEGGRSRGAVGGEDRAPKKANVRRNRSKGGRGSGESKSKSVYGAGGLKSGGDDLNLASEGKLGKNIRRGRRARWRYEP